MEIWMEQLMAFLQKHWQFTIIGCGLLIFIGALLNWRWVCEFDHRRVRPFAFDTLVHDFFGDQGYHFLMGISGTDHYFVWSGIFIFVINNGAL